MERTNERPKFEKSTGPGWERIVQPLIAFAEASGFEILQIKEKFGGLRFYYKVPDAKYGFGSDESMDRLIDAAEREADVTCEWCGMRGKRTETNWVKVLCPKHTIRYVNGERWWLDRDGKHI